MDVLTGGSGGTEAFPLNELPVGFGMALAMNEQAMHCLLYTSDAADD